ncbi:uncharacterized membrane protein YcaP (DUF421 family) [Natranaerovirga hydrolytica]|uniref:Uncharacterized membrane protein YcaP (DUF421 family) n=1 Tax=Natranaerovirga hydrolytica TaxID=680378 RepID=A0A4R1MZ52_9FIRM|nr:DUF421 domain-containing protein [Natranaerovirga hydrolytica]TCK98536.1 uncharacterized membrane protein YcaP (DUF421 family) [Natranaerovirga hydrolytica]
MGEIIKESIILLLSGVVLLRLAGRKSISQLTIAQTVIMISIGSLIIQPIIDTNLYKTLVAAVTFIAFLIVMEHLQMKCNLIERLLKGHAVVVIQDGQLDEKNLRRLRLTVDQLEVRLREQGVKNIKDVKTVTCEANGQIGVELKREAQPLTIGEFEKLMADYIKVRNDSESEKAELFEEVIHHRKHYPKHLE